MDKRRWKGDERRWKGMRGDGKGMRGDGKMVRGDHWGWLELVTSHRAMRNIGRK